MCVCYYISVCDNGWLAMKVMLIAGIVSARFVLKRLPCYLPTNRALDFHFGTPLPKAWISTPSAPGCTRYTKPTLAYVVQAVRRSCNFLRTHFLDFQAVFFDSGDKTVLGIHTPCHGLYLRQSTELAQTSATLMLGFTATRAIRRTCDLARPI